MSCLWGASFPGSQYAFDRHSISGDYCAVMGVILFLQKKEDFWRGDPHEEVLRKLASWRVNVLLGEDTDIVGRVLWYLERTSVVECCLQGVVLSVMCLHSWLCSLICKDQVLVEKDI